MSNTPQPAPGAPTATENATTPRGTHIVVLLDRSGSMSSIADDVIGGFNTFLKEQRFNGADARMSLVQFDSQDPQSVTAWGLPIAEMVYLDGHSFVPRGSTPLLDATGLTIGRTIVDQQSRVAAGLQAEDIVFVTITDGQENCSTEFNLAKVRELIDKRKAEGWTFVFLSAGLDGYGDAAAFGIHDGDTQRFDTRGDSAASALRSVSRNMSNLRDKKRRGEAIVEGSFFETGKDAEENF